MVAITGLEDKGLDVLSYLSMTCKIIVESFIAKLYVKIASGLKSPASQQFIYYMNCL